MPSSIMRSSSIDSSSTFNNLPINFSTTTFNLPEKLRHVIKQIHRSAPDALPGPNANVHEVRYFLYQLLTVEDHKVARSWPQWVLETCARWAGTGEDLREMSYKELEILCPLDSGHCKLDKREKIAQFPSPECRKQIATVLTTEIKKLKTKEGQKAKLMREWRETQLGSSAQQRVIDGLNQGQRNHNDSPRHPSYHQITHARGPMSSISTPVILPQQSQHSVQESLSPPFSVTAKASTTRLRAASVTTEHPLPLPMNYETPHTDAISPTTSGEGSNSSRNTNSTSKVSIPGSIEQQSMLADRPGSRIPSSSHYSIASLQSMQHIFPSGSTHKDLKSGARPLSTTSLGHDYFDQPLSSYVPVSASYDPPSPHPIYQYAPFAQSAHISPSQTSISHHSLQSNVPRPSIIYHAAPHMQRTKFNDPEQPRLYSRVNRSTISLNSGFLDLSEQASPSLSSLYPGNILPRAQSPKPDDSISMNGPIRQTDPSEQTLPALPIPNCYVLPQSASRASSYFLSHKGSDSALIRAPIDPNSMNYPRSNISAPRLAGARPCSPPTSVSSSRARSVATSFLRQYPINKKVPVVDSFQGPNRSSATAGTDRFALEQGSYLAFKARDSKSRNEVIKVEVARMHGMVPSNLHGVGLDHVGPAVRVTNPVTGDPYPTLVEQIREKEILDGKRQRGAASAGGLDSDPMKNDCFFNRGR